MAAFPTVPQHFHHSNFASIIPQQGVVTLSGYGISVRVDRGHLVLTDGVGRVRREGRFARVGHGLRRLIVIGSDGGISLEALRWIADQRASFLMLDRMGKVLVATGPVRPSDARLRRSQALAETNGAGIQLCRELIAAKLAGQENLARTRLGRPDIADSISQFKAEVEAAKCGQIVRQCEALGAKAYWSAWRDVSITFPRNEIRRVPKHWQVFGTRESPLTNSPRLAATPANAILNYAYSIVEAEARLAATALGLDPGLGVLHLDSRTRDSLACDLMEPVRNLVDAYLFDWLSRGPLKRNWFFEERNGNCRLTDELAEMIGKSALTWSRAVAPFAERAAQLFWAAAKSSGDHLSPAARLTQTYRKIAKGSDPRPAAAEVPESPRLCKLCGTSIRGHQKVCSACAPTNARDVLLEAAHRGRIAARTPRALAQLAEKQRSHRFAEKAWKPTDMPSWLDQTAYDERIRPQLADFSTATIALELGVSIPYASDIRNSRRKPHPRHWLKLAALVGLEV
jgi:CRISPR-associated endonuclease Cas1